MTSGGSDKNRYGAGLRTRWCTIGTFVGHLWVALWAFSWYRLKYLRHLDVFELVSLRFHTHTKKKKQQQFFFFSCQNSSLVHRTSCYQLKRSQCQINWSMINVLCLTMYSSYHFSVACEMAIMAPQAEAQVTKVELFHCFSTLFLVSSIICFRNVEEVFSLLMPPVLYVTHFCFATFLQCRKAHKVMLVSVVSL